MYVDSTTVTVQHHGKNTDINGKEEKHIRFWAHTKICWDTFIVCFGLSVGFVHYRKNLNYCQPYPLWQQSQHYPALLPNLTGVFTVCGSLKS